MELAPGTIIAAAYRLERPLASGGMGSLWAARHLTLDAQVAIKFMDAAHADSEMGRARFQREAKSLAAIRNPHVVAVRDYGLEDELPYIVMELLHGEDLGARLRKVPRLSLAHASSILTQIARGLRTAHEAGIVHRDLKPANVFLARSDDAIDRPNEPAYDGEVVKILDFGIAKNLAATAVGEGTKTGELLGSPHFMSPEQVRAPNTIDQRSDLWSLGVIVFRVLTGELPFKGDQMGAVLARILTDPIPQASALVPGLPPAVDGFFARALARDPEQRFQSAREMAQELANIAEATQVDAVRPQRAAGLRSAHDIPSLAALDEDDRTTTALAPAAAYPSAPIAAYPATSVAAAAPPPPYYPAAAAAGYPAPHAGSYAHVGGGSPAALAMAYPAVPPVAGYPSVPGPVPPPAAAPLASPYSDGAFAPTPPLAAAINAAPAPAPSRVPLFLVLAALLFLVPVTAIAVLRRWAPAPTPLAAPPVTAVAPPPSAATPDPPPEPTTTAVATATAATAEPTAAPPATSAEPAPAEAAAVSTPARSPRIPITPVRKKKPTWGF
jgi:serine/threonine-protein kinase